VKYHQPLGVADPNAPYVNGNVAIGLRGSVVDAGAIEFPQREIVNVIASAGLVPTDADLAQLWKAIQVAPWILEYCNDTGTADNYAGSLSVAPPQLYPGMSVRLKINNNNTGAATFTLGTFGTFPIVRADGSSLGLGDLKSGQIALLTFTGSNAWQITNYLGGGGGGSGSTTVVKIPYSVDSGPANAMVGTFSPTLAPLAAGDAVAVKCAHANTSTVTLQCDAQAAKQVKWPDGSQLAPGQIQANMILFMFYDGAVFQLVSAVGSGGPVSGVAGSGCCYLSLISGNLVLKPKNGSTIIINNAVCSIPAAGISLGPGALAANTTYYIYAYMNAGVMTLEASTTGHSTSTISGMEIKTGDESRTLVGMAATVAGPAFQDQDGAMLVLSWFNRQRKRSRTAFNTWHSTSTRSPFVEIGIEIRNSFITWGDPAQFQTAGASRSTGGQTVYTGIAFDGVTPETEISGGGNGVYNPAGSASGWAPLGVNGEKVGLTEGRHYATLVGSCQSGAGTVDWVYYNVPDVPALQCCTLTMTLWG
jgi:hypothetical protein